MKGIEEKAPVLSAWITLIRDKKIDATTLHQAKRVLADTIGVAYGGVKLPAFQKAFKLHKVLFAKGNLAVWGTDQTANLAGAVFYNALSVSSTDYDEGHRKAVGHPASTVVPAAWVVGEYLKKPYPEVLKAVILGYEAGTRFSYARKPEFVNSYSTGRWGALAAAYSTAYLLELSHEQTMHALSLAFITSPAMQGGSTDVSTGSMAKEGVAWAVANGVQSAFLASQGFVAPYLFIDAYDEIDKDKLLENKDDDWLIMSNYFKPFACCRWLHTAIGVTIDLMLEHKIDPEDIGRVEIKIFGRIQDLMESRYPENIVQAQFHLPFTVACAILFGEVTPKQMTEENLNNERIKRVMDKISLVEEERFNRLFPGKLASGVTIVLASGKTFYAEKETAPWDAGDHPSDEELFEKFQSLTGENSKELWANFFRPV